MESDKPEYWLRGPIGGLINTLQPVSHALMQARYEVFERMKSFESTLLFEKRFGLASPAFHLMHMRGVIDRLFTYARGEKLSDLQLSELEKEGVEPRTGIINTSDLLWAYNERTSEALQELKLYKESDLAEIRRVGRKLIPSTVLGLLFHAAEHTMRHTGQLLVTSRLVELAGQTGR